MSIEWSKNLAIGIPTIDEQHEELFAHVNAILASANLPNQAVRINYLFNFLDDYARDHFTFEEEMQERAGYPRRAEHKKMHDGFRNTLAVLKARHGEATDPESLRAEVNQFVVDWLVKHISIEDTDLAKYLTQD
jgi:hemerythrin-like metal-binding protein